MRDCIQLDDIDRKSWPLPELHTDVSLLVGREPTWVNWMPPHSHPSASQAMRESSFIHYCLGEANLFTKSRVLGQLTGQQYNQWTSTAESSSQVTVHQMSSWEEVGAGFLRAGGRGARIKQQHVRRRLWIYIKEINNDEDGMGEILQTWSHRQPRDQLHVRNQLGKKKKWVWQELGPHKINRYWSRN